MGERALQRRHWAKIPGLPDQREAMAAKTGPSYDHSASLVPETVCGATGLTNRTPNWSDPYFGDSGGKESLGMSTNGKMKSVKWINDRTSSPSSLGPPRKSKRKKNLSPPKADGARRVGGGQHFSRESGRNLRTGAWLCLSWEVRKFGEVRKGVRRIELGSRNWPNCPHPTRLTSAVQLQSVGSCSPPAIHFADSIPRCCTRYVIAEGAGHSHSTWTAEMVIYGKDASLRRGEALPVALVLLVG